MSEEKETNVVVCGSCGYAGMIDTYHPSFGMYSDCRCPKCGSTDNEHNAKYSRMIQESFKKHFDSKAP